MRQTFSIAALLLIWSSATSAANDRLHAELRLERDSFSLGEPVVAHVTLRNELTSSQWVDLGANGTEHVGWEIAVEDRPPIAVAGTQAPGGIFAIRRFELAAGEYRTETIILNAWQELVSNSGQVRLSAVVLCPTPLSGASVDQSCESEVLTRSNQITVQFDTYDKDALTARAAELLRSYMEAPTRREARRQALLLSYFRDPAALPMLAEILTTTSDSRVFGYAVDGLVRVGAVASVETLERSFGGTDEETKSIAVNGLLRLQSASDHIVRSAAKQALRRLGG